MEHNWADHPSLLTYWLTGIIHDDGAAGGRDRVVVIVPLVEDPPGMSR